LNTVMKDYANRVNGTLVSDKISLVMSVDWSQNKTHQVRISADDPKLFSLINPNVRVDNSEMQPEVYLLNEDQNEEWNWEYICYNNYNNNIKQFFIGDRCYVYSFGSERYDTRDTYPNPPSEEYLVYTKSPDQLKITIDQIIQDFTQKVDSNLVSKDIIIDIMTQANPGFGSYQIKLRASDPTKFIPRHPNFRGDFFPVNEYIYTISQEHAGSYSWELTSSNDNY
jgi:hypothetical protein